MAVPTHEKETKAQELLASWLQACGFDCDLQDVAPGRTNLIAQRTGRGATFLCSHVDVHPPHGHLDAFLCRRDGDVLIGRGVLDAKGQIAALVAAVEAEPEVGVLIAITCDEEHGGLGSELISLPRGPWSEEGGVILEPTDFSVCTAQAGHVDVHVEVSGTPGHAYAPDGDGSPVQAILSVVNELDTLSFLKAEHALLGRPRRNVGRISGGEHPWRRPGHAEAAMTLGVVPGTTLADAVEEVRSRLDGVARRLRVRGASLTYDVADASEPIEFPMDLSIVTRLAAALDRNVEPAGMPSWTDAGNLYVKHDQPCVVFGAGQLDTAHSDEERVAVADLVRLSHVLSRLIAS